MKRNNGYWLLIAIIMGCTLALRSEAFAASETLVLWVNPALANQTATVTIAMENVSDVESLSLELNFAAGTSLSLPATAWFSRNDYFPLSPFGAVPTVELNDYRASSSGKKIYIAGFNPSGASGQIGQVSFKVNPSVAVGDSQVLSLSGKIYSRSGQVVKNLSAVSTIFTVGTLPNILALPSARFFSVVTPGNQSAPQTITIHNTGTANLALGDLFISGTNAAEFSLANDQCSGQTITPGSSRTVGVIFAPFMEGLKTANLSIPSNDPDTATLTVALNMTGDASPPTTPGDINGDTLVNLTDAVLALQIACGMSLPDYVDPSADINNDGKIGLAEAIQALQSAAGLR